MGNNFADQYSFLHFCVGAVAYFWRLSLRSSFLIHLVFELVENTPTGMKIINKLFVGEGPLTWPGGKDRPDGWVNMVGDNVFFVAGWIVAQQLDRVGSERGWYLRHTGN